MAELSPELAAKRDRLLELLRGFRGCAVAFSGGVDSSVLAFAARLALGDRAVAVTGLSDSSAADEREACRRMAEHIGIRHERTLTHEMSDPAYLRNEPDRCYLCKREVIQQLWAVARLHGIDTLADGSNADDARDYRPGSQAAKELGVRSPLAECGLSKAEIRQLAEFWGLPNCGKPSSPCLSTRIAYGETITPERLRMIERAEKFLAEKQFSPLRVRYHKGDVARIEVPLDDLHRLVESALRDELVAAMKSAGFTYVTIDLEGFRSGSMNAMLPG